MREARMGFDADGQVGGPPPDPGDGEVKRQVGVKVSIPMVDLLPCRAKRGVAQKGLLGETAEQHPAAAPVLAEPWGPGSDLRWCFPGAYGAAVRRMLS